MVTYTRKPLYQRGGSGIKARMWLGSTTGTPNTAILTEDGIPIRTEAGEYLLTEG